MCVCVCVCVCLCVFACATLISNIIDNLKFMDTDFVKNISCLDLGLLLLFCFLFFSVRLSDRHCQEVVIRSDYHS